MEVEPYLESLALFVFAGITDTGLLRESVVFVGFSAMLGDVTTGRRGRPPDVRRGYIYVQLYPRIPKVVAQGGNYED